MVLIWMVLRKTRAQGHYESLQVPNEVALTLRTKALLAKPEGGRQENRGGGKSLPSLGGRTKKAPSVTGGWAGNAPSLGGKTKKAPSLGGHTKASGMSLGGKTRGKLDASASSLGGKTRKTVLKNQRKTISSAGSKGPKTKASSSRAGKITEPAVAVSLGGLTRKVQVWQGARGLSKTEVPSGGVSVGTCAAKVPVGRLKSAQHAAPPNPILVGKRAPKKEWTCNLCHITLYDDPKLCPLYRRRTILSRDMRMKRTR